MAIENGHAEQSKEQLETMKAEMEKIAEDLIKEFEEKMEPVMDSLTKARDAFEDLDKLLDEEKGFDFTNGLWKRSGWQEMERLRRKLENLKELRDLVRSLGRSGGKGPKRKAPAQVNIPKNEILKRLQIYRSDCPEGVIRSPLQPEETSGLCRSGDLSRMLASEAVLVAAGWSKRRTPSRPARLLHLARRAERNLMSYERSGFFDLMKSTMEIELDRLA